MYNKIVMVGYLARDIELRYLPSGAAIAKSAIATSHRYKTQTGEQKEETCFLDFSVFGKSAEILNQYVRKGSKVLLEGRLALEQWTAQDGTNRSKHSLRVETFKFLDNKSDSIPQQSGQYQVPKDNNQTPKPQQNNYNQQESYGNINNNEQKIPEINIEDEEIPF